MIKLKTVEYEKYIPKHISNQNGELIMKYFKKGYLWMLWVEKSKSCADERKKQIYLTIFKNAFYDKYDAVEYYLGDNRNLDFKIDTGMEYDNMNVANFECFLLTKEEADPYLKELLVKSLNYTK